MNNIGKIGLGAAAVLLAMVVQSAVGHGNVTPQVVDTHTLKPLGEEWLKVNPYSGPQVNGPGLEHWLTERRQNRTVSTGCRVLRGFSACSSRPLSD
jgi:hypothetical protein